MKAGFALPTLLLFAILFSSLVARPEATENPIVDPAITAQMARSPDGQARFIVHLRPTADLSAAGLPTDRVRRRVAVYHRLRTAAQAAQTDLIPYLRAQLTSGHVTAYRPLWIINGLAVTGDRETLDHLASLPAVERITADRHRRWIESPPPQATEVTVVVTINPTESPAVTPTPTPPANIEWNIVRIGAADVWQELRIDGTGIVVANMDTGVLYTHPALADRYRGHTGSGYDHDYNWYDATGRYPTVPADGHGHGTHTMGIILGDAGQGNQIGVAPGARWIAVKVLDDRGYGYDSDIHAGFQWLLAPTDLQGRHPDPSLAPQVVNNSWGSSDGLDTEFRPDVQALLAAGIIPVFSAGNDGPFEGSIGAPAGYPESWAVGATDYEDRIAYFSGRGPSPLTDATKPELVAPGVAIRSSWKDGGYHALSGTSMAAPHVAGLVALILQAAPYLTPDEVLNAITSSAVDLGPAGPDYDYGWGRIDAYAAVLPLSIAGTLTGRVTDGDTGAPIPAASVIARAQADGRTSAELTDPYGTYTLTLAEGRYDLTVTRYGYFPLTATVAVTTDQTTVRDFSLPLAPHFTLSGHVTEVGTGDPLAATILIHDTPLGPIRTDPATGFYSVTVVQGTYSITVKSRSHTTVSDTIAITADLTADFALLSHPSILLVDDDGDHYEGYFTRTLAALGEEHDLWDTALSGPPALFTLEQYPIVIWTTGALYGSGSIPQAESALLSYLEGGGMLFLSSSGYFYATPGHLQEYLHIALGQPLFFFPTSITGAASDPVGAWLGPYTLIPIFERASYAGPDSLASTAFKTTAQSPNSYPLGVTCFDRRYPFRTVYLGFPFEALREQDATVVMRRILAWFRSDCSLGTLRGTVTDSRTHTPIPQATVTARSLRDHLTVNTNSSGVYTLSLLADTYSLHIEADGYNAADRTAITVSADTTTTQDIFLRPQIVITPAASTVTLTAGRTTTRTLLISNSAPNTLTYILHEETGHSVQLNVPVLNIPFSNADHTTDGHYTPGEWDGATVVYLTPYDDPGGDPVGEAHLAHSADTLYVLLDYYGHSNPHDTLSGGIQIAVLNDLYPTPPGGGRGRSVEYYYINIKDGFQEVFLSTPSEAQAGLSSTPALSTTHWTFEYAISTPGLEMRPGSGLGLYLSLWSYSYGETGGATGHGEWYNRTIYYDTDYDHWAVAYLDYDAVPWLTMEPFSGTVAAGSSRAVTLTFEAQNIQPGIHTLSLLLTSLDYHVTSVAPPTPITMTVIPSPTMGWLTGRIGDRRTGDPLVATVSTPGLGATTSETDGTYLLWLDAGSHPVTVTAPGYLPTTATVSIAPRTAALPHDFALRPDTPQISLTTAALNLTATWGSRISHTLTISNGGFRPLTFQIYETTLDESLPVTVASNGFDRFPWRSRAETRSTPARLLIPVNPEGEPPPSPFIFDPQGDGGAADLILGEAAVGEWGWDGSPPVLTLRLTFAPTVVPREVVGYLCLDTDRDPNTGRPPQDLSGAPGHDIGYDYYLDLFTAPTLGLVDIWRQDGRYLGSVPADYGPDTLTIRLPLSLLEYDDGLMDITLALGTPSGVQELAPETGHTTIGLGAAWLGESPANGVVPPGTEHPFTLTLDTARLQPGVHYRRLLLVGDDPLRPQTYLPLTITLLSAPTMGALTGSVTDLFHKGLAATVAAPDFPAASSDPATGRYTLWLNGGEHAVRAFMPYGGHLISRTLTVHIAAQEQVSRDFVLPWCAARLPIILK